MTMHPLSFQESYGNSEPMAMAGDSFQRASCPYYLPQSHHHTLDRAPAFYSNVSTTGDSEIHRREDNGSLDGQWQATQFYGNLMSPPSACEFNSNSTSCTNAVTPSYTLSPRSIPCPGFQSQVVQDSSYSSMAHQPSPLHPVAPVPIPCHAPSFLAGDVAVSLGGPDLENRYQDYPQMINTFPTPSELLFEVQSNEATSPISDTSGDSSSLSTPPKLQSFAREVQPAELSTLMVHSGRDGISSHEKKRQLLECLEHYVLHLHEQLTMIGAEPVPLERVADYRGLSSRSIRTLLVHMENKNKELNSTIVAEEERFLRLREALYRRDVPTNMALQEHPESQINGTVPYV